MSAVRAEELVPGSVVHLDPKSLIAQGNCWTIAKLGGEVKGDHMFVFAEIGDDGMCLATPLMSEKNDDPDRVRLNDADKSGAEHDWREPDSAHHYFKWQFWRFPAASVEAASKNDDSFEENRRTYGQGNPSAISALTSHLPRAREPWRRL